MTQGLIHRPHLDGLRGLAIIMVVLGHLELINGPFAPKNFASSCASWEQLIWQACKFGWIGVDLFFVISGYLIMRIVLHSVTSYKSILVFFARRFLRIFPLFVLFLGVYFFATQNIAGFDIHGSKYQFYFDNQLYLWFQGINFLRENEQFPQGELAHLWSLALEEQFYLALPLLYWLNKILFKLKAVKIFLCFLIISLLSIWLYKIFIFSQENHAPFNLYVSSFIRGESIIWGCLIAYLEFYYDQERFRKIGNLALPLIALGISIVTLAIARAYADWGFSAFDMKFTGFNWWIQAYGFSGLSIICAGILLYVLNRSDENFLMIMLNNKILKKFGKYCYGIYMTNTLVIAALVGGGLTWFHCKTLFSVWSLPLYFVCTLYLSLSLALFLWWGIEARFLALKQHPFIAPRNSLKLKLE